MIPETASMPANIAMVTDSDTKIYGLLGRPNAPFAEGSSVVVGARAMTICSIEPARGEGMKCP